MRPTKLLAFLLFAVLCASTPSLAATRYWVPGGDGSWNFSTSNWSATSGGASGASIPTTSDDVTFDSNSGSSNYTVDVTNGRANNLTIGAPSSGTVTFTSTTASIVGNVSFAGSGVSTGDATFNLNGSTSNTLTTNGLTLFRINIGNTGNQTGTWTLQDNATITTLFWYSGNINDGGHTLTSNDFAVLASGAGTATASTNWSWRVASGITTTSKTISQSAGTINFTNDWGGSNISAWTFLNATAACPTMVGGIHVTGTFTVNNSCTLNISGTTANWQVQTLVGTGVALNFSSCTTCTFTGPAQPSKITANTGGTFTLAGDVSLTGAFEIGNGTVAWNNHNATFNNLTALAGTATMTWSGSELITLTGTGTVWNMSGTLTLNPSTGTIKTTDTSASSKTFGGGGKATYPLVWFSGCGTGAFIVTGANTFTDLKMDSCGTNAQSLTLPASTTTTLASGATFPVGGQSGHVNTLISSSSGTKATLSKASGTIAESFLSIKDSGATGGATFNAFISNGNVNVSNNSGWNFAAPPGKGLFHSFPP